MIAQILAPKKRVPIYIYSNQGEQLRLCLVRPSDPNEALSHKSLGALNNQLPRPKYKSLEDDIQHNIMSESAA